MPVSCGNGGAPGLLPGGNSSLAPIPRYASSLDYKKESRFLEVRLCFHTCLLILPRTSRLLSSASCYASFNLLFLNLRSFLFLFPPCPKSAENLPEGTQFWGFNAPL